MLIFIKNSIRIKASSREVINSLEKMALKPAWYNSFTENSFTFSMRESKNRMYNAFRFHGKIEEYDDSSNIKYSIRPGIAFIIIFLVFFLPFIYAFVLFLFSINTLKFLTISAVANLIIFLIIVGQEQACNERLIRKLHELEIEKM